MSRLTHKIDGKYYPIQNKFGNLRDETYGKLGQLEDIEELFGIDLISIFKVDESSKKKNTTGLSILDEWFKIVWNCADIEDDYKDILCNYNFVLKDLERLENIEKDLDRLKISKPLISHCLVAIKHGLNSYRKNSCTLFDNLVETFGMDYLKKLAKEWEDEDDK